MLRRLKKARQGPLGWVDVRSRRLSGAMAVVLLLVRRRRCALSAAATALAEAPAAGLSCRTRFSWSGSCCRGDRAWSDGGSWESGR